MELTAWQLWRSRVFMFVTGVRRRMTIGARTVLIKGNEVFLIRHTYLPGWQFCGGGVEPGETPEFAAEREMVEETGYKTTGPMQLFGLYHNPGPYTDRDYVALYVCRSFVEDHPFVANSEIAEAGWFAVDALPEGIDAGARRRIAEIFAGAPISATW